MADAHNLDIDSAGSADFGEDFNLDMDVSGAVDPNAAADGGTYTLEILEAKLRKSREKELLMANMQYKIVASKDPKNEKWVGHILFDNAMLEGGGFGERSGKFKVKQLCEFAGVAPNLKNLPKVAGLQFVAELTKEKSEQYGEQNRVKPIKKAGVNV